MKILHIENPKGPFRAEDLDNLAYCRQLQELRIVYAGGGDHNHQVGGFPMRLTALTVCRRNDRRYTRSWLYHAVEPSVGMSGSCLAAVGLPMVLLMCMTIGMRLLLDTYVLCKPSSISGLARPSVCGCMHVWMGVTYYENVCLMTFFE